MDLPPGLAAIAFARSPAGHPAVYGRDSGGTTRESQRSAAPTGVSEVSRFSYRKFLGVHWGLRLRRTVQELALIAPEHVAFRTRGSRRRPNWEFSQLNTQPTYTPVYASWHTSRCAAQNSGPSGSLLLTREALSSSTSYRFIPAHPLPSTGVARLPRYYEPLRHPTRPGRSLASCQLILIMITAGASRVASGLLCVHAIAITPAGSMKLVRSSISTISGLPCVTVRSALAIVFSGPAQRLLTLWPARSPSRLATLYIESSDSFVASAAVSIATGWSEPVPGRELHPEVQRLSRRTVTTVTLSFNLRAILPPFAGAPLFQRQLVSNVIFVDVGTTPEACRYLAAAMGLT